MGDEDDMKKIAILLLSMLLMCSVCFANREFTNIDGVEPNMNKEKVFDILLNEQYVLTNQDKQDAGVILCFKGSDSAIFIQIIDDKVNTILKQYNGNAKMYTDITEDLKQQYKTYISVKGNKISSLAKIKKYNNDEIVTIIELDSSNNWISEYLMTGENKKSTS